MEKVNDNIKAREFVSGTKCELDEDGYWKAVSTIVDKVLYKDATEWIEEKIESMSIDRDYNEAIKTAMGACVGFLSENIYAKGFSGLVEFREYERRLKDASEAKNI